MQADSWKLPLPAGRQGDLIVCLDGCNTLQLWYRVLEHNKRALAFLNLSDEDLDLELCIEWEAVEWHRALIAEVRPCSWY